MIILDKLTNARVSYKLIGAFVVIALLSGIVGVFSILQLNTLDSSVKEIVEVNVEQADWSMEIIIALETQVMTIHAAMLGETEAQDEFYEADKVMTNGFANLSILLAGTEKESSVESLESKYQTFYTTCYDSSTGVFALMEDYKARKSIADQQFWRLDTLQDKTDASLSSLEQLINVYALDNSIIANATLIDNSMELNLLLWRMIDKGRMYVAVPLTYSENDNNSRQQYLTEYADAESVINESDYVQTGLERDFTDLLNEAEVNIAWGIDNSQINSSASEILVSVRKDVVFDEEDTYESLAEAMRCQEDGVFYEQDHLIADWIAADSAMETADGLGKDLKEDLDALELWVGQQMHLAEKNADNIYNSSFLLILSFALLAVIFGTVIGFLMSRSITKPLDVVVEASTRVADSDLTMDMSVIDKERKDELGILGNSVNSMVDSLREIISTIQVSSEQVSSNAQELASTSEEVNALSEEIAATIQQISRGASNQTELSTRAMDEIKKMSDVVDKSLKDITSALSVIEDIAGQTNILALNAAIEAARAGEYGRGFAVVADNVRRLAEETKNNSGDITTLTSGIVTDIGGSVFNLQETLQSFAAQSEEFGASSEEVAAATEEQTASMNQMTSAAQSLSRLGEELSQQVAQFKLTEK